MSNNKQNGQTAIVVGDGFYGISSPASINYDVRACVDSGLTKIAKNMSRILEKMGFKVIYVSISGHPYPDIDNVSYFIGNSVGNPNDPNPHNRLNSVEKFDKVIEKFKPTLVVSVHDFWMLFSIMFSSYRENFTYVSYSPCEADYYPQSVVYSLPNNPNIQPVPIAEVAKNANYIIAYNEFGAKGITSMGAEVRKCIHNGMNTNEIFEIHDKQVLLDRRRAIGIQDDWVMYLHMGRNSIRKRPDILLESWFKFTKLVEQTGQPLKAKLYVHTDRYSFNGLDIPSIIKRLNIEKSVVMPNELNFSAQDLNIFYNAADVYVGLPGGEGHGLGFSEAMYVGKPLIYGCYGGHTTYCKGAGIEVPAIQFLSEQNIDAPRAVISSTKAANAMFELYNSPELRKKYGDAGREIAKRELTWDVLDDKFISAFEEALGESKTSSIFAKKVL